MKKIIFFYCHFLLIKFSFAQISFNNISPIRTIKQISCKEDSLVYYNSINQQDSIFFYAGDLKTLMGWVTNCKPLRFRSNDSARLHSCFSVNTNSKERIYGDIKSQKVFEDYLKFRVIDTTIYEKVWILHTGESNQIKPLKYAEIAEPQYFSYGVYTSYLEDLAVQNAIISKEGLLSHLIDVFENLSNRIIMLENENKKKEKFTFEISKSLIERGNFEEIKAALKEAIDFDLYEDICPVKVKYVKFLD